MPTPRMADPSLAPQPTWRTRARCRSDDADCFYAPPEGESRQQRHAREQVALALCRACPVQSQCLAYALDAQEPHGIWGGADEVERRRLLRSRSSVRR